MVKRVFVFSLPESSDSEEFWKFWVETHAPKFKKVPGLRKYVINRVTKVAKGDVKFWGLVETWWDSKEAHDKSLNSPEMQPVYSDNFGSRITGGFGAWVEENEILK
jgi:uncharacterized protein (TIGR02118 family)